MNNWGQLGVFDLETTGIDVETARIVSACIAVLAADGTVIARWDWLADPGIEIPDGAAAVHGITTERARAEGRPAHLVVAEITQALSVLFGLGIPLVVYNAPYDLTLLDRECRRHQLAPLTILTPVIDPLVIDKAVDRYRKGKRTLEATADRYGVTLDDAHDAGSDAIAAGRVAQALGLAYPDELDISLPDLHGRQEVWYAEQAMSFQAYIRSAKGDEGYLAETEWPIRPAGAPSTLVDTQPIPAPQPRVSLTVPISDAYGADALVPDDSPTNEIAVSVIVEQTVVEPTFFEQHFSQQQVPRPGRSTVLRVAAAIVTDASGRTLLVRKRGTTAFMQAGGKIERGESALDALTRELREEVGLVLDLERTEYLGSFRAAAANEADTVVRAEVFALSITDEPVPSAEIEELLWLESGDAPEGVELAPLTRDTILPLWAGRRAALF
ncbi:MAG: exonuclease domain-containing protein [Rhodoglobus sp.]